MSRAPLSVGISVRMLGSIFVDRTKKGGNNVAQRVQDHLADEGSPPLMVFPEGTRNAGRELLEFRTGSFIKAVPVQPLLITYPTSMYRATMVHSISSDNSIFFSASANLYNPCHIRFLPVYTPDAAECRDPELYAANLRAYMAKYGKLGLSSLNWRHKDEFKRRVGEGKAERAYK